MTRAAAAIAVAAVVVLAPAGDAHKGITSRFTYNADVYPVFLKRCGRCHIDGGVGPMSLLKYEEAFPWAESLRSELLDATTGDPHDFIKAAHRQISARELDIVLDWATGGTPEGDKSQPPPPVTFANEWIAGTPTLVLTMTAPFEMPASTGETTHEVVLPFPSTAPHTVTQIDLLPGNPAIVRSAAITLQAADGVRRTLGTWVPRQTPVPITLKPPVRVEPGSHIVARLHYKKSWKLEGEAVTDQSAIGLYSTD
jgi:hypothetical protein